jgi:hypothetical protein
MINLDGFINKQIVHKVVEITSHNPVATLPEGVVFTGDISYSGEGSVYLGCIFDNSKPVRNFKFKIVDDGALLNLPYNYRLVGTKMYPLATGGAKSISVYVEKEL